LYSTNRLFAFGEPA